MSDKRSSFLNIFKFASKQNENAKSETNVDQLYKEAVTLLKNKEIGQSKEIFENILTINPNHHNTQLNLAKIYIREGLNTQSIELLKKYLLDNPNSFEAKIKLIEAYIKAKEFELAIGNLNQLKNIELEETQIPKVNKMLVFAYYNQAKDFKAKKQFKEALSCHQQVYTFDKDKEKYLFEQALCYKEWKYFDKAVEIFNQIIKIDKSKYIVDAYYHIGQIEESRNLRKAVSIYKQFIESASEDDLKAFFQAKIDFINKNYEEAIESYTKALKVEKYIKEIYLNIAKSYMFQKNYAKAVEFYEKRIAISKDIDTLINLVICKIHTGDVVKAFEILNKISEKDYHNNPTSAKNIGIALFESGILEKAFDTLSIAREIIKNDPEISVYIAKYYKKTGDKTKYSQELQKTLKEYPNDTSVLKELAELYKDLNQEQEVIETYEKILDLDPRNKEPLRLMAEFYNSKKNLKQAIAKYNEYLSFIKSDVESIYKLALCYFDNIEINKAIQELQKIEGHVFHGLTACSLLTDIYISKGETDKAISYIEKCFVFAPSYIDGYLKYGKIFAHSGQIARALEYLRYAEKIDPNNKDVQHFINYYSSMK